MESTSVAAMPIRLSVSRISERARHGSGILVKSAPKPLRRSRKTPSQGAVVLEMPFAAHGLDAGGPSLRVDQGPHTAACRFCADAGIVLGQATLEIERPPDIRAVSTGGPAAKDIDKPGHNGFLRASPRCLRSGPRRRAAKSLMLTCRLRSSMYSGSKGLPYHSSRRSWSSCSG